MLDKIYKLASICSLFIDLTFSAAPFWVEEPTDVEASIDKKATFSCKADGDPKPEHTWYISGVALKDSMFY